MKNSLIILFISFFSLNVAAQNFKYAFVTDTHIGTETGEEDLQRTVADINNQKDIDFTIVTGDITEMGTNGELKINSKTGETLWRNKEATIRESIGLSADSSLVYGKTMQDEIVAYKTEAIDTGIAWKHNAGYGYEHTPSDLFEKNGKLFFGTKMVWYT